MTIYSVFSDNLEPVDGRCHQQTCPTSKFDSCWHIRLELSNTTQVHIHNCGISALSDDHLCKLLQYGAGDHVPCFVKRSRYFLFFIQNFVLAYNLMTTFHIQFQILTWNCKFFNLIHNIHHFRCDMGDCETSTISKSNPADAAALVNTVEDTNTIPNTINSKPQPIIRDYSRSASRTPSVTVAVMASLVFFVIR